MGATAGAGVDAIVPRCLHSVNRYAPKLGQSEDLGTDGGGADKQVKIREAERDFGII